MILIYLMLFKGWQDSLNELNVACYDDISQNFLSI